MKTRFSFIDPGMIMGVVVAMIILAVGVFAFFVTLDAVQDQIPTGATADWLDNKTWNDTVAVGDTSNSVFNIVGIVLIIGAIMAIVGLVYNYVR